MGGGLRGREENLALWCLPAPAISPHRRAATFFLFRSAQAVFPARLPSTDYSRSRPPRSVWRFSAASITLAIRPTHSLQRPCDHASPDSSTLPTHELALVRWTSG